MKTFQIGDRDFLLDGEPFQILSGALHYFRVHPDQWADRIDKAREMGLNTIETYVAWNAHAPRRGEFRLDGGLDLGRFLDAVADAGMYAIVRPGPYICAEWDNGGLPAWLFEDCDQGIRRTDPAYLKAVDAYLDALAPILVPRQIDRGGPIILVQIENEYGAYGSDKEYLRHLTSVSREIGLTVPFVTVDQPTDEMLVAGGLPELHKTGSFGSRPAERLATLRAHQPHGPLMCMEFWDGWFDHWGEHHHTTPSAQAASDLDELLRSGASVNIYMFHGGTNFGFTNGANDKGVYRSIATSYDYDAPLDEAGRLTPKYYAFQEVLSRYGSNPAPGARAPRVPLPTLEVSLDRAMALWSLLEHCHVRLRGEHPPTVEAAEHYDGFVLYSARLPARERAATLSVGEVRDRAYVYLDRTPIGTLARDLHETSLSVPPGPAVTVNVLVENQGRVNYGPRLGEPKGLIGPVTCDGVALVGWDLTPVPLDSAEWLEGHLSQSGEPVEHRAQPGPSLLEGTFDLPSGNRADLALSTMGLGKGVAWINGFNLGRFWSRGPQRSLYVPAPLLREKGNRILLLALTSASTTARFVADLDLGHEED